MIKIGYKSLVLLFCFQLLISCGPEKDKNNKFLFKNLEAKLSDSVVFYQGERYTGPVVQKYRDGSLEFSGNYENGKKTGIWNHYFENRELSKEEDYSPDDEATYKVKKYRSTSGKLFWELIKKGEDTLLFKKYHHNGRLGQELTNYGRRVFKKWSSFGNLYHIYDEDTIVMVMDLKTRDIIHKGYFKEGKRNGPWFKYYKNGNKQYQRNYKLGNLVGYNIDYYKNGNIEQEANYNDRGILQGEIKKYHQQGPLFLKGEYDENGLKTGTWTSYTQYGKIWFIENYKKDKLNGYYRSFTSRGVLTAKGYYKDDKKVGDWYYYDKTGKFLEMVRESFGEYKDE